MPTLRKDMSVGLRGEVVGSDDFDKDLFETVFGIFIAELCQGAFGKKLPVMDDAYEVEELFDCANGVGGEDEGVAGVAAFANEGDDGAGGHDIEAESRLVEDRDRGMGNKGAGDGGFLLHAGGELVAAAVAEAVHVQAIEDVVDALFQSSFVQTVEADKVFDKLLSRETRIERGGGGKEADIGADFFWLLDDIVAANESGAVGGLEDGGQHAQGGGFAGAVGAEETVNLAGLEGKTAVIDRAECHALLVLEALGQATSFDHRGTPSWEFVRQGTKRS